MDSSSNPFTLDGTLIMLYSQLPPMGRKTDFPSQNSNESLPTQSSSFGPSFGGPGAPWTQNGIWGTKTPASGTFNGMIDQGRSSKLSRGM